jgi:hypothetical protein
VPPSEWPLRLDSVSIPAGTPLIIHVDNPDIAGFRNAQCSVSHITPDEDEWVMSTGGAVVLDGATGTIRLETTQLPLLDGRLYRVSEITVTPGDASEPDQAGTEKVRPTELLFEVLDPGQASRSAEELRTHYQALLKAREAEFLGGIGEEAPGSIEFRALIFLKNCLMSTRMRLGRYELIPFRGLGSVDELGAISDFLVQRGQPPLTDIAELSESTQRGQPCAVVHVPRVFAQSLEHACELLRREMVLLCDVLSLHRMSYGAPFGGVLFGNGRRSHWIDAPNYMGNWIGGLFAGEFPRAIKTHVEKARSEPRIALYFSLLREATAETRTEFAYFRLWNLLETIARSKGFSGKPEVDWAGAPRLDANGVPALINGARSLVFELIRTTLAPRGASSSAFGGLKQSSFEELVSIWYRHRNCVVHGGGCFPQDPSFCLRTKTQYTRCKDAHDELVGRHGDRGRWNDEYLAALRATVVRIMQAECR